LPFVATAGIEPVITRPVMEEAGDVARGLAAAGLDHVIPEFVEWTCIIVEFTLQEERRGQNSVKSV